MRKPKVHLDTFFSKPWENFLNPKYTLISYKIQSFGKNVSNIIKPQNQAIFNKKRNYKVFSWTCAVFRTCPNLLQKMSWTGFKNTSCPNSDLTFQPAVEKSSCPGLNLLIPVHPHPLKQPPLLLLRQTLPEIHL